MNVLIDASALVKILLLEPGREEALRAWYRANTVIASRLAYPEIRAALAAAARGGRITEPNFSRAKRNLDAAWTGIEVVELDDVVARAAGEVAERFRLRAGDAVHLASALVLGDPDLTMATWDAGLARAAHTAGLHTTPAWQ